MQGGVKRQASVLVVVMMMVMVMMAMVVVLRIGWRSHAREQHKSEHSKQRVPEFHTFLVSRSWIYQ